MKLPRFKRFLLYECFGLFAFALTTLSHPETWQWNMKIFGAHTAGVLIAMVSNALNRMKPEE